MTAESLRRDHGQSIDLGQDDPLYLRPARKGPPDRRRVSLRWLGGGVFTSVLSALLIGGALHAAVGIGRVTTIRPALAASSLSDGTRLAKAGRKGNRLRPPPASETVRRVLQVSTLTRSGDRDLVKVRPFAHVRGSLTLSEGDRFADRVPAYEPLKLFSERAVEKQSEETVAAEETLYGAEVEGEVTIKVSDFPTDSIMFDESAELTVAEVERTIREATPFLAGGAVEVASLPYIDEGGLEVASTDANAFAPLAVAIVPENVSLMEKSDEAVFDAPTREAIVTIARGDALTKLLEEQGSTSDEARWIQAALVANYSFDFRAGQKLRIEISADETGRARPVRVSLYGKEDHIATVALSDSGAFVPTDEPLLEEMGDEGEIEAAQGSAPSVHDGVWRTGLALGMSPRLIEDFVRIFSFDVDFQARATRVDDMEVVYSTDDDDGRGEILFAALTQGGVARHLYRFRAGDDNTVDYYDEQGKSANKFLLRKPMSAGRFRSPFGMRRHPILGRYKMHTGVDWAAPTGTPIMASGNGRIAHAGWKSGYGKHVKIEHAFGYVSQYSHMSAFAKGIKPGARVTQGQIIGYVGSTGLSTGPHLHYEVLVNKRFVDPMKIRLPRGRELQGPLLTSFSKERMRVDALLARDGELRTASTVR